jgi:hypothetical protein
LNFSLFFVSNFKLHSTRKKNRSSGENSNLFRYQRVFTAHYSVRRRTKLRFSNCELLSYHLAAIIFENVITKRLISFNFFIACEEKQQIAFTERD